MPQKDLPVDPVTGLRDWRKTARRKPYVAKPGDKRLLSRPMPEACRKWQWRKGESGNPGSQKTGKRMMTAIREQAAEPAVVNGKKATRLDKAADAFVQKMEEGSFIHTKEYIDREEGRTPQIIAGADGQPLKLYIGMPVDEEEGAP